MGPRKQQPLGEEEFLPSTTRAVAWGAMFFAFLAFLMSGATLALTWRDGQLVNNAGIFLEDVRKTWDNRREEKLTKDEVFQRDKVRHELDRYVSMIQEGDSQVRFYLDSLRDDLERLRNYSSDKSRKWLTDAADTVQSARDQLGEDAPEAARRLRDLAGRLSQSVRDAESRLRGNADSPAEGSAEPIDTRPKPNGS